MFLAVFFRNFDKNWQWGVTVRVPDSGSHYCIKSEKILNFRNKIHFKNTLFNKILDALKFDRLKFFDFSTEFNKLFL